MVRMSLETRQRAVLLWKGGMKIADINLRFKEEGFTVSLTSLYVLIGKFSKTGEISDKKRLPRQQVLNPEQFEFIDKAMEENDELTAYRLLCKLKECYPYLKVSLRTIHGARQDLGWVSTTPHYCQLIREVNKEKRLFRSE